MSPCDGCEENEAYCFLECIYNDEWQVNSPCNECSRENCNGCDYADKKAEVEARKQSAVAS